MPQQFIVPERTSSKLAFEEFNDRDHLRQLILDETISSARKKLKSKLSLDSEFFGEWGRIYGLEVERVTLRHKQSQTQFCKDREGNLQDVDLEAWIESEEAKSLHEKKSALELNVKLFKEQADGRTVEEGNDDQLQLRHFMQLCTNSTKGLAISDNDSGMGRRDPKIQSDFREALIKAGNSNHPHPNNDDLWCPVLNGWVEHTTAAHIFPYNQGQAAMSNIFGTHNELHKIENGLILSTAAEERIGKGDIVLVPNVSDASSKQMMDEWSRSNPKQYKIRVLNPTAKHMNIFHPCGKLTEKRWTDLDGNEVHFRSNHRPRTRYMYWLYCQTMLRRSWKAKAERHEKAKEELGKRFWGTRGPYMKKNMLRAFVLEMGQEYEHLLEGAVPETASDNEPNPMALAAANNAILRNLQKDEDADDDDDDSEVESD
ncbi:MAG: hypothetical protein ASARMPRED_005779 [Alectoria sarmentosa]|nr:MAG: hypothetical protein ASARMPRED_005779 [Alectoria sarmentosa]